MTLPAARSDIVRRAEKNIGGQDVSAWYTASREVILDMRLIGASKGDRHGLSIWLCGGHGEGLDWLRDHKDELLRFAAEVRSGKVASVQQEPYSFPRQEHKLPAPVPKPLPKAGPVLKSCVPKVVKKG